MTPFEPPRTPPTFPHTSPSDDYQRLRDMEHLRILSILHYVYGGLVSLAGCAGILYIVLGIAMAANPRAFDDGSGQPPPPAWAGSMLSLLGGCVLIFAWGLAALIVYSGRCLSIQRNRIYCMVIAGLMCLSIPFGTLLGIFTLIVLARPSVAALFAKQLSAISVQQSASGGVLNADRF